MTIPKIIHYFHRPDVKIFDRAGDITVRMCYMSWKRYCPEYQIMHWHNEMPEFQEMLKNSKFLRRCYELKIWALVSDYVRNYALYNYGGVYLDTDVELIKNIDEFLNDRFFVCTIGNVDKRNANVEPAVLGGEKGHIVFIKMMEIYNNDNIFEKAYDRNLIVILPLMQSVINELTDYKNDIPPENENWKDSYETYLNQKTFYNHEHGIRIYPAEYFSPHWDLYQEKSITENTAAIHWASGSWWVNKRSDVRFIELRNTQYKGLKKIYHDLKISKFKTIQKFIEAIKIIAGD